MEQLDALRLADALRQRLVDFSADQHFVRDRHLSDLCRALWAGEPEAGGLLSDLWVEGSFPAAQAEVSLADLARTGEFNPDLCAHLDRTDAAPAERPLYQHQREALRHASHVGPGGERPAVVVTAGTGAGKTEAFLFPLLHDLYTRADDGAAGMKCLILYPMNALVNDQVDRLYSWLQGQDRVTLFHFTSETPEDKRRADRGNVPVWEPCRLRTRQQARGRQRLDGTRIDPPERGRIPDIVITNYSMLEYMLCRPQDAPFFGPALRAVVLDEAHLYTGTLAAEITLLLRRLYARCRVGADRVLQVATSATLGSGDIEELRAFAATLFTKDPHCVHVVQGQASRTPLPALAPPAVPPTASRILQGAWPNRSLLQLDGDGTPTLVTDPALCARLREPLCSLVAEEVIAAQAGDTHPAALLHRTLGAAPIVQTLEEVLWERQRLPLRELAVMLWGDETGEAIRATIRLLQLTASARTRPGDYPLVPHRLHLLARASDGLCVCMNGDCSGPVERRLAPLGTLFGGVRDRCDACGNATLALNRCGNCGEWVLAGRPVGGALRPAPAGARALQHYSLTPAPDSTVFSLDPSTGERLGAGEGAVPLHAVSQCPRCKIQRSDFVPFVSTTSLTLSILAETALAALPVFPSPDNAWLPARGRRMLAFSDSRREAACLGPRLRCQHETQLVRAAVIDCLDLNLAADAATIEDVRRDISQIEERLGEPRLTPAQRQRLERQRREYLQQLDEYVVGGSISQWAEALARHELLAEMLDPNHATRHLPPRSTAQGRSGWSQHDWESNRRQIQRRSRTLLAQEFARRPPRGVTAETLGLAEITYPGLDEITAPLEVIGRLATQDARDRLSSCWPAFLQALCDSLRADGVITLGDEEEDRAYPFGDILVGRWCAEDREQGSTLVRFVGETRRQRRRAFAAAVLEACGLSAVEAEEAATGVLRAAFRQLLDRAVPLDEHSAAGRFPWLQRSVRQVRQSLPADALRLFFPGLGLRRPVALFRCERTGHIWCRSVLGSAPEVGCAGTLQPVGEGDLDQDPRLGRQRREYREAPVFRMGLWAEEHSAQLAPSENRRLQDLFKAGVRNLLSATTTLELGIDIGGLNAVLMSNVPPGKANYLQRAGRAGRRADGSSVVITFARSQPFDREVFHRFGDYLGRPLRRPRVFLERQRLARRHLNAFLLSRFFEAIYPSEHHVGAMRAFGDMGLFCGVACPQKWDRESAGRPSARSPLLLPPDVPVPLPWWNVPEAAGSLEAQFRNYLHWARDRGEVELRPIVALLFGGTGLEAEVQEWRALLDGVLDAFSDAISTWRDDYEPVLDAWTNAEQRAQANALRYQLLALYELTVIEALADRQFLPRYGFPIGVHKLRVIAPDEDRPGRVREEDQYRLARGSLLALGEYVPGSQLLVGGRLVASHGLLKHWTGADLDSYLGLRGQYCHCREEHFYYWLSGDLEPCPICRSQPRESPRALLFPAHGFSSAAWDPPRWSTDVERVGKTETATVTFSHPPTGRTHRLERDFAGVAGLSVQYREDGELLVYNRGDDEKGFAICLSCGYTDSERHYGQGRVNLPRQFERHAPLTARSPFAVCWRDETAPVLRNQALAARETTDVLLLDFSGCLDALATHEPLVTTLGYALKRAGARLLGLDTRELGVLIVPASGGGLGTVLYDNVPGGAGHVLELLALGREWLSEAREILFVSPAHDGRCDTACLDCLLSFDAQEIVTRNLLDRRLALGVLDALLNGGPLPMPPQGAAQLDLLSAAEEEPRPSNRERIDAARRRLESRQGNPSGSGGSESRH